MDMWNASEGEERKEGEPAGFSGTAPGVGKRASSSISLD